MYEKGFFLGATLHFVIYNSFALQEIWVLLITGFVSKFDSGLLYLYCLKCFHMI